MQSPRSTRLISLIIVGSCFAISMTAAYYVGQIGEANKELWIRTVIAIQILLFPTQAAVSIGFFRAPTLGTAIILAATSLLIALGYGDIQPIGTMRAVAAIEALYGFLMVPLLVAIFVSLFQRRKLLAVPI